MLSISFSPEIGGLETHLEDLLRYVGKSRHVHLVCYQPLVTDIEGAPMERARTWSVRRIRWLRSGLFLKLEFLPLAEILYLVPSLLFQAALYAAKPRRNIGLIHAHGLVSGCAGLILAKLLRLPAIVSLHSIYGFQGGSVSARLSSRLLNSFNAITTMADKSKKEMMGWGVDGQKILLVRYWVDLETFSPRPQQESRKSLQLNGDFIACFVGRLIEVKGLRLIPEVAATNTDITFLIAGDGPLAPEVRQWCRRHKNIVFFGGMRNDELPVLYSASDVLLVPSMKHQDRWSKHEEGFPRVIVEALACGTPVIASRVGGIPEALSSDVGILVEPLADEVNRSLELIRGSPDQKALTRLRCRQLACERYSERNAELLGHLYDRMMSV